MAVCDYCNQEMTNSKACTLTKFDGEPNRIPNGDSLCHDCNTPPHGLHHPGCDSEKCPICGGQAISCDCVEPTMPTNKPQPN